MRDAARATGHSREGSSQHAVPTPPEERIGRTMGGRWTLQELLGVGGSASVFAAQHRNGRRAAVKVLRAELAANESVRRRFLDEGYAANRVEHPGAVVVFDDGEEGDGTAFLVMELLRGESLARRYERGLLETPEIIACGAAILDVLAAAHDRGILHRDVKPSNVFRTESGRFKLLDFGVARIAEANEHMTPSWTAVGTPTFMSPELAAGRADWLEPRSDIWSVGASLFYLLAGTTVHEARTLNEALVCAATQPARSLRELRPELPAELTAIVDKALSFNVADRWPNARAMQRALLQLGYAPTAVRVASDVELSATTTQSLAPARTEREQKRGWMRPAGFAALGLVALGMLAPIDLLGARRRGPTEPATRSSSTPDARATLVPTAREPLAAAQAPSGKPPAVPTSLAPTPSIKRVSQTEGVTSTAYTMRRAFPGPHQAISGVAPAITDDERRLTLDELLDRRQ